MSNKGTITVVGCGVGDGLSPRASRTLKEASVIAGGKRILAQFSKFSNPRAERIELRADIAETTRELIGMSETDNVVILASGDALFHGIAGTLSKLHPSLEFEVLPNITAFQALCAALKLPWGGFSLFSVHGSRGVVPWREILASNEAAVYCDNRMPAHKLAAELLARFPRAARRECVVCADLGMESEIIRRTTLREAATMDVSGLSILLLLKPKSAVPLPCLPLGLPDGSYEHENNLITHPETRAVILSKLRLRNGVMWDLGAGSGSVGIEAAGLRGDLRVHAVERSPDRVVHIKNNAASEGLRNHETVEGEILEKMGELPDPDIVFIGGGGPDIEKIALQSFERLRDGGDLVASAVTLETISVLNTILREHLVEAISLAVSRSAPAGRMTMMRSENPINIYTFHKGR